MCIYMCTYMYMYFNGVGTCSCVPIREVSSFQRVLSTGLNELGLEDVPL